MNIFYINKPFSKLRNKQIKYFFKKHYGDKTNYKNQK